MDRSAVRNIVLVLIRHRFFCLSLALLVCAAGYIALLHLPRDSFPDITPVRVEVDTQVPGLAAEEVEKLITFPLEQALRGIPRSTTVRSTSKFSLSVVEVHFESGTDLYWARSQVFQSLSNASLPSGITPQVAPMDEGSGQVFIYTLASKKLDNMQLRTLQDFLVKPRLKVVSGVADVPMFGGFVKQFQVVVDPNRLLAMNVGLGDIETALQANNTAVGGNYLRRGSTQYVIRGLGLVRTLDDLRNIVITTNSGVPIRIGDVAIVRIGPEDRQGAVSVNGQGEVVAGIVIKRIGENTAEVIARVKDKMQEVQGVLAGGSFSGIDTRDVRIVTLYDQSYLIKQATDTVTYSLVVGAVLVVIILLLLTGSARAALIPIFANVFCIMVAFLLMTRFEISANLLSLGGLALSLGMMVDATVMIVENVYRHVVEESHDPEWSHEMVVAEGVAEILKPTVLAVLVIVAVFLPVLTLHGIEGQLFIPLALAVVFSMVGSLVMALMITPGLCFWLIRPRPGAHSGANALMRALRWCYARPLGFSVRHPWTVVFICTVVMALSVFTFRYTGSEFLPPLEEGNFRIRLTFPPSVSLPYMMQVTRRIEQEVLATLPEATQVASFVGRPELGGDPESVSNDEVQVDLKPVEQWRPGVTKESMAEQLREALQGIPNTTVQFSQQLEMRTDEMISGFNTPIAIFVLGTDADALVKAAHHVRAILQQVPGATDVGVEHITGIDNLDIVPDRVRMARVGATINGVMDVVQTAIGGNAVGQVYLDNQRFDIALRMASQFRTDVEQIRRLRVSASGGARVPLSDVASVKFATGLDHVDRYNGMRRVVVMADVRDRSVGSVVEDARARIQAAGPIPGGCTLHWGGQAEEAEQAFAHLSIAIPGTLLLVFLLIYACFDNLTDTAIVLSSIPLGIAGGTFLLMFMHLHLNVPAYIGFIAKFGIAVQNGMIMVAYMNRLRQHKSQTSMEAAVEASLVRLRPELLSALIGSIGLVPFLLAAGTGATVERPLAAVVIGGVAVSRPMAWFLIPALYAWWKKMAPAQPASQEEGLAPHASEE